jgi:hypothetical protein
LLIMRLLAQWLVSLKMSCSLIYTMTARPECIYSTVKFYVPRERTMKNTIFWNMTLCSRVLKCFSQTSARLHDIISKKIVLSVYNNTDPGDCRHHTIL